MASITMRIPRIYVDLALTLNNEIVLPPLRSHYLLNVLRLQTGRSLIVFNGKGGEYQATLVSAKKKTAIITTHAFNSINKESPLNSELAIGMSKGDRMDWVVQKATELGVNEISLLLTERTELKLNPERWEKKIAHWQEIIISACEQSGRNILPTLNQQKSLAEFLDQCSADCKLMLHTAESNTNINSLNKPELVSLLVGPEGGFSNDEVSLAEQKGFLPCLFGPRVLRTETAPIVALSIVQHLWGDY